MKVSLPFALFCALWLSLLSCANGAQMARHPTEPSQLADPRVEQAHADACAAMEYATGAPLCRIAPPLPQRGRGYAAISLRAGVAAMLYDRDDIARIIDRYGYESAVWLFGHEAGHVADLVTGQWQDGPTTDGEQLRADAWGGCVLRILGYSALPVQAFIRAELGRDGDDFGEQRAAAAMAGWISCWELGP